MGHKIHPTGLRLGITQDHRSRWYAPDKTYPTLLQEDDRIRKFIHKKYNAAGISDVLIARKADQLEVELKTARPGVLVGRQGSGIEELRSGIQKTIGDSARRMRALLRRTNAVPVKGQLSFHDIEIDLGAHRVSRNGRRVHLGPTEYRLLEFLMQHPRRVFTREELLDAVWGNDAEIDDRTVDVHIGRLRRVLNRGRLKDPIRTIRGAGYSFDETFG